MHDINAFIVDNSSSLEINPLIITVLDPPQPPISKKI